MFVPSFIALSMSSALATPSGSRLNAAFIIGTRRRFTTKPGDSLTSTASLPSFVDRSLIRPTVASLVSEPRITSTSFITGAGKPVRLRLELPLDVHLLEHGLDDDLRSGHGFLEIDDPADLRQDPVHIGGGHLSLLHALRERLPPPTQHRSAKH